MSDTSASGTNMTPAKQAYLDQLHLEQAEREARRRSDRALETCSPLATVLTQSQAKTRVIEQRPDYKHAESEHRRWQLWRAAGVPAGFQFADLAKLSAALPDEYHAAAATLKIVLDQPAQCLITGDRETGKTWLGCGMCRIFCRDLRSALYTQTREMFDRIADAPFDRKDAARNSFARPKLLIIDNPHMRRDGYEGDALATLIDRRASELLSTVLIMPMTTTAALENLGPLIRARIKRGVLIETTWPKIPAILRAAHQDEQ